MKRIFTLITFMAVAQLCYSQAYTYQRDTTKPKNCFDEYYESFMTRGALPVPDGEHEVVYSIRTDTSCFCGEAKVTVKDGLIVPYALVKKQDGTYEETKKKLNGNYILKPARVITA